MAYLLDKNGNRITLEEKLALMRKNIEKKEKAQKTRSAPKKSRKSVKKIKCTCKFCGKEYYSARITSRYCSDTCRAAYSVRKKETLADLDYYFLHYKNAKSLVNIEDWEDLDELESALGWCQKHLPLK